MSKKPMSWLELIKMKLKEEKGASMKDIMPAAKKIGRRLKPERIPYTFKARRRRLPAKRRAKNLPKPANQ